MTDKDHPRTSFTEDVDERQLSKGVAGPPLKPASLAALPEDECARIGRRATLKLDVIIMPCMVIMYIFNYLDRQNIAAAKLAGIEEDLHISDVEYQTCVSILFVGYSKFRSP
jgi:hypothetical protein